METENNDFTWTPIYMEFADKLLSYKNDRKALIRILEKSYQNIHMNFPYLEKESIFEDICPFTVFEGFNRGVKHKTRIQILEEFKKQFDLSSDIPSDFNGIPILNNQSTWFFGHKENRGKDDIQNLWDLFETALIYADNPNVDNESRFLRKNTYAAPYPIIKMFKLYQKRIG